MKEKIAVNCGDNMKKIWKVYVDFSIGNESEVIKAESDRILPVH